MPFVAEPSGPSVSEARTQDSVTTLATKITKIEATKITKIEATEITRLRLNHPGFVGEQLM